MSARHLLGAVAVVAMAVLGINAGMATTITIHNTNAAGVGFNDITPAVPVAGNLGVTLGQQRLNVFQQAANQWAALLNSNVTIIVDASMVPLSCTSTTAVLGSAGPVDAIANFPNAPRANTAYNIAEANALAGSDREVGSDDINARFNVNLGNTGCLDGEPFWYGLDPAAPRPTGVIPLLPVVFHELAHGLGFTANVDSSTGDYFTGSDTPVWANYLFDTQIGLPWKNMSSAQRLTSTTHDPFLVWAGPRTNKQAAEYLLPGNALLINGATTLPKPDAVGTATFGPTVPATGITGDLVLGVTGTGANAVTDGCNLPFVTSVSGKIALFDRGVCNFTVKVKNAQTQGALAAIIINNVAGSTPAGLGGSDATVTIASYGISADLGALIKTALGSATVNVTLGYANIGVHDGCVRMFAPSPVQSGSSVSHFHSDAFPNLLMEPALNTTLFNTVDLTIPLFADIGWSTNKIEDFIYTDNFDPNACSHVQP